MPSPLNRLGSKILPKSAHVALHKMAGLWFDSAHRSSHTQPNTRHQMITFHEYIENLPLIHCWGDPPAWNTGGFDRDMFEAIHKFMIQKLPQNPRIIETGCGNSTIFFLFHNPSRLISIDPWQEVYDRILAYCEKQQIDRSPLDILVVKSETVLPKLAEQEPSSFDVALIDGNHGWPGVMVDFCYMLTLLKPGGFLIVDDINLYSIGELTRLLEEQPEFSMQLDLRKTRIYRKEFNEVSMPEWFAQPYIVRLTGLP
jgi:predicted O-methyltransferase YrrM